MSDNLDKVEQALVTLMGVAHGANDNVAAARDWLDDNEDGFTDGELYTLLLLADTRGVIRLSDARYKNGRVADMAVAANNGDRQPISGAGEIKVPTMAEQFGQAARIVGQSGVGPVGDSDLNDDGRVDAAEKAAVERAKGEAAKGLAGQQDIPESQAKDLIEAQVSAAQGLAPIPNILEQYMGRTIVYGEDPDFDSRVRELITTWNTYNPDRQIADREGLYQVLGNANDPDVQDVMDAVFLGTDPVIDYKIPLANGGSVSVTAQQFDAFQKGGFGKYGQLDRVGLTNLVRITDRIGLTKHDGSNAWQMTAALARAKAADTENAVFTQSGYKGPKDPDVQKSVYNANKIASLGLRFKEGRYIYGGNDSLAYIHTLDPTLAAKWANTPDDVSQEEVGRLRQLINNGGFDQQQLSAMGYEALSFEDWANDPARSGNRNGGGGGGRMRPDPVAVRQAARDMWMNLYASEPSEQQLNDLIATVDGSISNAPNSQSVDVEAQIRQGLEANPQYAELYGSRPAGMSEQEWQTQFRAGAASLLGNEAADPNSIRSGMRSGQYQTTLGAVAGSRQAWGNSTFRGRLAQAAQIVAEQT